MPQVRVEATDLIMVRVVTDNLEGPYNETEDKCMESVSEIYHSQIVTFLSA